MYEKGTAVHFEASCCVGFRLQVGLEQEEHRLEGSPVSALVFSESGWMKPAAAQAPCALADLSAAQGVGG